jgi:hypothetical protein
MHSLLEAGTTLASCYNYQLGQDCRLERVECLLLVCWNKMASIIIISQESRECSEQMNFVKHFNKRIAWVTHASTTVMLIKFHHFLADVKVLFLLFLFQQCRCHPRRCCRKRAATSGACTGRWMTWARGCRSCWRRLTWAARRRRSSVACWCSIAWLELPWVVSSRGRLPNYIRHVVFYAFREAGYLIIFAM